MRKNPASNWKVYGIIDSKVIKRKDPEKIALSLFKSGVNVVQLRYKNCPSYKLVGIAKNIQQLANKARGVLIINDRPDVALASKAGGIHMGEADMPLRTARLLLTPRGIIGKTVHRVGEIKKIKFEKINYISVGPIFATPLKKTLRKQGVHFIKKIKRHASIPLFAIGGINEKNLKEALEAGADGVCVARATPRAKSLIREVERYKRDSN